jgi:hypothetical protein
MGEQPLKIIVQLKAVIQKDVTDHFSRGRLTLRGIEEVQKYAQERLDLYIGALKKESKELENLWSGGHPFVIRTRMSLETHSYAVEITTKDGPKNPPGKKSN